MTASGRIPHGRIEHEIVEILKLSKTPDRPFQARYEGKMQFDDGEESEFITDVDNLETEEYHVMYGYTETVTGEVVVEIHGIIDSNYQGS